eukprot:1838515-Prymnesium_polylepis.1
MQQLMGELRSWKQQNERRLQHLSHRAATPLAPPAPTPLTPHVPPPRQRPQPVAFGGGASTTTFSGRGGACGASGAETPPRPAERSTGGASPAYAGTPGSARRGGEQPSLRELQRELLSLKSSLSVYLGT